MIGLFIAQGCSSMRYYLTGGTQTYEALRLLPQFFSVDKVTLRSSLNRRDVAFKILQKGKVIDSIKTLLALRNQHPSLHFSFQELLSRLRLLEFRDLYLMFLLQRR